MPEKNAMRLALTEAPGVPADEAPGCRAMKFFTKWSEADTKTKVLQIVMIVVAFYVIIDLALWLIPQIAV